jgi:SPP1 gp7 family putative phage head morphogenesis protein
MATTVPVGEGIPPEFYRNAIDLNRFSNSVSKKLVTSYNNVMLKAVSQLEQIERQPLSKQPAYKTARLRALIKQTKQSLNSWANGSVDDLITELEGVAKVQAGFIEGQLKKSIPKGMAQKITDQIGYSVRSVAVSPSFAKSVVTTDPTAINLAVLKSELAGITKDKKARTKGTFKLTAEQGQTITLPNGNTVKKSFLGIAQAEAKRLNQVVRSGLLSGETTTDIVKDLVGNLRKDQKGSLSQLLAQGGAATKSANSQVMTIVRTTVNQVTNTASQTVYKANPDVTEEYRYVATLDSRTSPVCRDLDGQIFKYNQGPVPPQHFGCRSTTVAVVNYKKYGFTPPPAGKRASVGGPVPANTTYGKWLYGERAKGSKFKAGKEQIAALGEQKAKYFNRLSNKYGPDQALKKLIREDNTEVSLAQLQKRYGNPEDIKPKAKIKPPSKALIAKEGKYMTAAEKAGTVKYTPLTTAQKKLVDQSISETKFKKSVQDVVPDVATFAKLPKGEQSTIKFLDNLKLNSEAEQKYWKSAKAFNSKLIPKNQFKTITPKQLARRIEDDKIAKLQKKFDNKAKKALQPKKEIKKRDLRKWDDPSFLDKKLAGESSTSAVRKSSGLGKKTSEDLMFKPKAEEVGLTKAKFKQTEETIGQWAGSDYVQLRGVQLNQAQAVGAQLNPAQVKHLKRYRDVRARTEGVRNQWARYADQMEDYISKAPKWKGKPQGLMAGNKDIDVNGTIFRGMGFDDKKIIESIVESYKRGDAGLTMESWTANRQIASGFSGNKHSVIIKQVNKYGTSIEPWNGLAEREILQPRGVRYKVLSAETKQWAEGGIEKSFTEITLEAY